MVIHSKIDIRKRCHSASKKGKKSSEKRFKEHLSTNLLCKNFMGLGQIFWPQHHLKYSEYFKEKLF